MDLILLSTFFRRTYFKPIQKRINSLGDIIFFRIESRKDSIHACFLVGELTCEVASRGWLCPFNFACTSAGLAGKCGEGPTGVCWRMDRRVREGLCTRCTKCNWPITRIATGLPPELQFVYDWSCNRLMGWVETDIQTELQPVVQASCNWPTQPECNWPITNVAIYIGRKLQSVQGMSYNWYTNDDATSRLEESQLTTQHECNEPEQTPRIVSLPSESYDHHVRYGAALAVGISSAWTWLSEAISLLEPLTSDIVDFVRQGALIAMAMVMIQTNESSTNKKTTRLATCNKKTASMHAWNLWLVRIFGTIFLQNRNPDWHTVCCVVLRKICLAKLDLICVYFLSFKRVAYLCTNDCNFVY